MNLWGGQKNVFRKNSFISVLVQSNLTKIQLTLYEVKKHPLVSKTLEFFLKKNLILHPKLLHSETMRLISNFIIQLWDIHVLLCHLIHEKGHAPEKVDKVNYEVVKFVNWHPSQH